MQPNSFVESSLVKLRLKFSLTFGHLPDLLECESCVDQFFNWQYSLPPQSTAKFLSFWFPFVVVQTSHNGTCTYTSMHSVLNWAAVRVFARPSGRVPL